MLTFSELHVGHISGFKEIIECRCFEGIYALFCIQTQLSDTNFLVQTELYVRFELVQIFGYQERKSCKQEFVVWPHPLKNFTLNDAFHDIQKGPKQVFDQ